MVGGHQGQICKDEEDKADDPCNDEEDKAN
jgi:hypothetical protein